MRFPMNESEIALICKALGDENRVQIIKMLTGGELCACKILDAFNITQPTLSHDMKVLVESGLILDRRNGKNIYYSLNPEALRQLYTTMGEIFKNKPHCVCEEAPAPVEERMENSL